MLTVDVPVGVVVLVEELLEAEAVSLSSLAFSLQDIEKFTLLADPDESEVVEEIN